MGRLRAPQPGRLWPISLGTPRPPWDDRVERPSPPGSCRLCPSLRQSCRGSRAAPPPPDGPSELRHAARYDLHQGSKRPLGPRNRRCSAAPARLCSSSGVSPCSGSPSRHSGARQCCLGRLPSSGMLSPTYCAPFHSRGTVLGRLIHAGAVLQQGLRHETMAVLRGVVQGALTSGKHAMVTALGPTPFASFEWTQPGSNCRHSRTASMQPFSAASRMSLPHGS